jgi:acyl-coenzyme A thioesterase PaaI-like protein
VPTTVSDSVFESAFATATAATEVAAGRYAVSVDAGWGVGGRPNGGYLLACMQRAALLATGRPHPLSVSAVFLRPPAPGAAEVVVEPLRAGSTVASARARLTQDGDPLVEALVSAGTLSTDIDAEWADGPAPEIAPLEDCVSSDGRLPDGTEVVLLRHLDVRLDPATLGWVNGGGPGRPEMLASVALADGADPNPLVATLAADALPPVVFALGRFGWAPTVEMTTHTRALPAPGRLRVRSRARLVSSGWFDEEAEVWDSAGRLVTQSRQLARVGRG